MVEQKYFKKEGGKRAYFWLLPPGPLLVVNLFLSYITYLGTQLSPTILSVLHTI